MSVRCPGCGREYAEELFAYGRTIDCACGRRVGPPEPVIARAAGDEPRFMVDAMLGRLARWLRILGFDTGYEADIADGRLVRRAVDEGRAILTRDRRLPEEWRVSGVYMVKGERPVEQMREVVEEFGLAPRVRLFTRCNRCNGVLMPAEKGEAAAAVPRRVLASDETLQRCPGCGRFYWSGSHVARMRRIVEQVLDRAGDE